MTEIQKLKCQCECLLCKKITITTMPKIKTTRLCVLILKSLKYLKPELEYYSLKNDINSYIMDHWDLLSKLNQFKNGNWRKSLLDAFNHCNKIESGKEVCHNRGYYRLRESNSSSEEDEIFGSPINNLNENSNNGNDLSNSNTSNLLPPIDNGNDLHSIQKQKDMTSVSLNSNGNTSFSFSLSSMNVNNNINNLNNINTNQINQIHTQNEMKEKSLFIPLNLKEEQKKQRITNKKKKGKEQQITEKQSKEDEKKESKRKPKQQKTKEIKEQKQSKDKDKEMKDKMNQLNQLEQFEQFQQQDQKDQNENIENKEIDQLTSYTYGLKTDDGR